MFAKDASSIDKDQLRPSLRSRVSAFGAVLKPKRHAQYPSAIIPSVPQSECSTLVDFAIEDVLIKQDDELDFETEEYMLEAENSAWATGKYTVSPRSKKSKHSRPSQRVLVTLPESQLIDAENSAWVAPRATEAHTTTKARTRFFSSSRTDKGTSGIEPEYIDPEDRAWM
ncbi:hypothetical protein C8Q76DRAFT_727926 [Earliella scabrosa]|nr:hypothetical protein C8Q76DRAFT_727926 [Earliella scabrosa]